MTPPTSEARPLDGAGLETDIKDTSMTSRTNRAPAARPQGPNWKIAPGGQTGVDDATVARFLAKVEVPHDSGSGCWSWIGAKTVKGYGRLKVEGVPRRAHRVAYAIGSGLSRRATRFTTYAACGIASGRTTCER